MNLSKDRGPLINLISITILVLTTTLLILRCYVRLSIQRKKFSADDYVIFFSYANFVALTALAFVEVRHGTGKHLVDVVINNPTDLPRTLKVGSPHARSSSHVLTLCLA